MTIDDLTKIIAEVQNLQSELDDVEVKAALHGTPQRLFETLSVFSNRTGGGVLDRNRLTQYVNGWSSNCP